MPWGFFSVVHIISLFVAGGVIVGLHFLLRKRTDKTKVIVMGCLSLLGYVAMIFNLVYWNSPLEYLPLHLCSFTALMLPIAIFTKSKIINNALLLWSLGAVFALVVNTAQAHFDIFSITFFFYYFPHVLYLGLPILMFTLKLVKRDVKCIVSTIALTLALYTVAHFVNIGLNSHFIANNIVDYAGNIIQVNYMYSIVPENPLLQFFYNILPYQYWYMLLIIPIILLYLGAVYFDQIKALIKSRKKAKVENKNGEEANQESEKQKGFKKKNKTPELGYEEEEKQA